MAEHQKIHPVDLEAQQSAPPRPTAPLVPRGTPVSDKGDPTGAPPVRPIPIPHPRPPKRRGNCCCRCLCWSLCLIILLIVAIAATAGALYLIYRPKAPSYSVDRLSISTFDVDANFVVRASFDVTVTATNPNDKIGIHYVEGSKLSVLYQGNSLCDGQLPVFYQGHRNTTVLNVVLRGQTQLGNEVMNGLQAAQRTGAVPLKFDGVVPVRVKFGGLELWKFKALVRCDVVVDSLTASDQIRIRSSKCGFRFRL